MQGIPWNHHRFTMLIAAVLWLAGCAQQSPAKVSQMSAEEISALCRQPGKSNVDTFLCHVEDFRKMNHWTNAGDLGRLFGANGAHSAGVSCSLSSGRCEWSHASPPLPAYLEFTDIQYVPPFHGQAAYLNIGLDISKRDICVRIEDVRRFFGDNYKNEIVVTREILSDEDWATYQREVGDSLGIIGYLEIGAGRTALDFRFSHRDCVDSFRGWKVFVREEMP